MATINTPQARYSTGAIILHWLIAIAVIVNWRLAEAAEGLERPAAAVYMDPHKAIGMIVLVLTVARLAWRYMNPPPPMDPGYAAWERYLAKAVHGIFYFLLLALPLGGWFASSSFGMGIDIFGLFTVPALPVAENPALGKSVFELHHTGGVIMILLVGLHIAGALKHQFLDKNNELGRMIPGLGKR
ncbi:cytochrome b [Croceicoccus bisphenolivorans]|uniref:cytochrome b n=1 Tax=Croceicoccus bisphenolivorans TaxID=1783232 RepID=UPI00083171C4|nr:cytochrome b [Croceicoccus bisphenolivorans]